MTTNDKDDDDKSIPMTAPPSNPFRSSRSNGSLLPVLSCSAKQQSGLILTTRRALLLAAIALVFVYHSSRSQQQQKDNKDTTTFHRFTSVNIPQDGIYHVAIVGAGPAGLTAALFASRSGLSTVVFGSSTAGLLTQTNALDNFPSYQGKGMTWLDSTKAQAEGLGATFVPASTVSNIERDENKAYFTISLSSSSHKYKTRSIILATGATPRRLNLPSEQQLWGKSIHNCAICDGSLYENKRVLVVGGGDAAVDAALLLCRFASSVVVVHRRNEFRATRSLQILRDAPNIEIMTPYKVASWETSKNNELVGAHLKEPNGTATTFVKCDGAFLMIGSTPNTAWLRQIVELDSEGLVVLQDGQTTTSTPGMYAAGEIVDTFYRQAITAAAEGAKAAIDAERWLREQDLKGTVVQRRQIPISTTTATLGNEEEATKQEEARVDCDLTQESCIQQTTSSHAVVVFSKPYCPYCKRALEALAALGCKHPLVVNLVGQAEVQATLGIMTGRRTVPNVFIGGKSIGGGDETVKLHQEGKLVELLKQAGAVLS